MLENGANLKGSKGFHELVRSGVLDTELKWYHSPLFHRELRIEVAQVECLPVLDFVGCGRDQILLITFDDFFHESKLAAWKHVGEVALKDLTLHGVQSRHDLLPRRSHLHHFPILSSALCHCQSRSPSVLGNQFRDKLLLFGERHSLHSLVEFLLVNVWNFDRNLVELLLEFLAMFKSLGQNLLLRFLGVCLLLLYVHGRDDGFDGWTDLLHASVSVRELSLLHLLCVLESLQVSQSLVDWHHRLLLFVE